MELGELSLAEELADADEAVGVVDADEVADEEVAGLHVVELQLGVHGDAEEEVVADEGLVLGREAAEEVAEVVKGALAVEGHEEIALALGDALELADGAAALGDDGLDDDVAGEGDADDAVVVDLVAEEEGVAAGAAAAAGKTADLDGGGEGVVEAGEDALARHGEGVHQHDEVRVVSLRDAEEPGPRVGRLVGRGKLVVDDAEGARC